MKKIISIILTITFVLSAFTFLASAESSADNTPNISKSEFAKQCREKTNQKQSRSILSEEEIDELIRLYMCDSNPDYYEQLLNDAGLYVYASATTVSNNARSDSSDIVLNKVSAVHNSIENIWILTAYGFWSDVNAIKDDVGFIVPIAGWEYKVGGYDAVGIHFYDVSGTTPNLTDAFVRISDNRSADTPDKLTSPSTYNDRYGIGFIFQDKMICLTSTLFDYTLDYYGAQLQVIAKYDSSFENFSGKAKMMYLHTIDGLSFNSISISNSGFSFGWTSSAQAIPYYSSAVLSF